MHPKFDPTRDRTHDLQIMTVDFMSQDACSTYLAISDSLDSRFHVTETPALTTHADSLITDCLTIPCLVC